MDFRTMIQSLEEKGMIAHVRTEVDPVHELAGVAKRFEGGKKALIFDKVKGKEFPVVCGLWWNRDVLGAQFGVSGREVPAYIGNALERFHSAPVPPVIVGAPPCQEIVEGDIDLTRLTIPTLALEDGGAYLDDSVVIAKDPDTGVRNTSIHRIMVTGKNRCTMLMDLGRHLRDYYERAEKKGQPLEITINNGVPASVYTCAITAGTAIDEDELGLAAALQGDKAIALSRSRTVGVEGIASAEVVLEGRILPRVREPEGPFGEVTGYYAQRDDRWVVEITAITRRRDTMMQTLLPGKEVWNSIGACSEAGLLKTLSKQVPGVKNVYLAHANCGFYGCVVQCDPPRAGFGKNAILAAFGAFPPLNMVTVVNSDVDIFDAEDVMRAVTLRFDPTKDLVVVPAAACHELNPVCPGGLGAKYGFDATIPPGEEERYRRVAFREVDLAKYVIE
ncbi:MAG: UbiD family decarboxylase [Schwartzia sp.]|nr:UbiD family decarboxylase [Schwartzia sp. (in: firmicutes)]